MLPKFREKGTLEMGLWDTDQGKRPVMGTHCTEGALLAAEILTSGSS